MYSWTTHPPYVYFSNPPQMLYNKLKRHPPRKMTETAINMQIGHDHCRAAGKYGRRAACECGISLVPLRLGAVIPIDAESLAK